MKKYFYIFMLLNLSIPLSLHAQRKDNVLKMDVIQPIFSTFGASYERFLNKTPWSIQLSGSFTSRTVTIWESLSPQLTGFSGELQGRRYFESGQRDLPTGVYAGAYAKYSAYKIHLQLPAGDVNFLDGNSKVGGIFLGYQHAFFNNVLCLDATLGGGYHFADYSGRFSEKGRLIPSIVSNGVLPKVDLKIGIAF
jgi:Protein of unknown function (DUF3575)